MAEKQVKALYFDVFGTVTDWRGWIVLHMIGKLEH